MSSSLFAVPNIYSFELIRFELQLLRKSSAWIGRLATIWKDFAEALDRQVEGS